MDRPLEKETPMKKLLVALIASAFAFTAFAQAPKSDTAPKAPAATETKKADGKKAAAKKNGKAKAKAKAETKTDAKK